MNIGQVKNSKGYDMETKILFKEKLNDLAILGNAPAFDKELYVGRPNIGNRQVLMSRINDILDRRWLTNGGPMVEELEKRIAAMLGVKHCIAICNATVALEIAIRAADLKGEVIVPSMTFVATAHALQWQEITPVFCDIDPDTYNLDPERIEELITPRTTGIIGVHLWGRPCGIESLAAIAGKHNLRLLFDAAHAFCCSYKGKMIGNFGDIEVFSFHATKFFNSLEGGAIVTNNDEIAKKVRLMKNFGFTDYDTVEYVGTNGKMNEVSAAMGLTSLESLDDVIATNKNNYKQYQKGLDGLAGVRLLKFDETERCNYQYIVLEIDPALTRISRDDLQETLWAENIIARRYFYPGVHRMEPYRSYFPHAGLLLPQTERLVMRMLSLPNGTAISPADAALISRIIRTAVENGADLSNAISKRK
jgi:dTDP-4-amino-4,6-dideoxygalactose transaminase